MNTFYKKTIEIFEKPENKQKFLERNLTPVQYIDLYAGQKQFEENFELFSNPAIFVQWNIDYCILKNKFRKEYKYQTQQPIAVITFYCCYEQLRDTSNISLNTELGLKFLDYVSVIDEIARTIETETTGKLVITAEGFHKMDSIVDIYLLTYHCSYSGRKKPPGIYQAGNYDSLDLNGNLIFELD